MTGNQNPKGATKYSAELFEVGPNGNLRFASELVSKETGAWWIEISYASRKIVIVTPYPTNSAVVVDFDKASVVKRCGLPAPQLGFAGMDLWLAVRPGIGLRLVQNMISADLRDGYLRETAIDLSTNCEASFAEASSETAKYMLRMGAAGVADWAANEGIVMAMDKDGGISKRIGKDRIYLVNVPENLREGMKWSSLGSVAIRDADVTVVTVSEGSGANVRLLALRHSDNTWRRIPAVGPWPFVRGFGRYIAITETQDRKSTTGKESAGASEWRKNESSRGRAVEAVMHNTKYGYPGRLTLYDIETERIFTITTNQGDSEVLLVEDDTVYYRVSDRLYSARLTAGEIKEARQVAQSEVIRDAHWAFISHGTTASSAGRLSAIEYSHTTGGGLVTQDSPASRRAAKKAKESALLLAHPHPSRVPGLYSHITISQGEEQLGTIVLRMFEKEAPITVKNFADLAMGLKEWTHPRTGKKSADPLYDGLTFYRVLPNFIIQGGDPAGNGTGGTAVIEDELDPKLRFDAPGRLGMASVGPGTGSCQFFITVAPAPHLNGRYTIFGEVVEGQDIVNMIARVPKDKGDRPLAPVVMTSVVVRREP